MNWTCPFCQRNAVITGESHISATSYIPNKSVDGIVAHVLDAIVCPNKECNRRTLTARLYQADVKHGGAGYYKVKHLMTWQLIPNSSAVPLPSYIKPAITADYYEACAIQDLSPKASATLARRCLQGMIRDFWGVSKRTLFEEIEAIRDRVDPLTWDAITAVRKIGNIGAHMEKDIDVIIDVEPNEAQLLTSLIEILFKEWYIARHERELRMKELIELANQKELQRQAEA
ncbi:DUF4145 domain-containing protein [Paenibacillus aurantiacus]|uniref:DUF4145 domain-containing protein n=1 Tax=Paenibacillus aurantiacus TaxID=1936118 RepID=A0ABV5KP40_9BACL